MTDQQEKLFIAIAQFGISCGLWHPFKWLTNYNLTLENWCAFAEIPEREKEANEAFCEFFNQCSSGEGDPMLTWTVDDMLKAINQYYEKPKEIDTLRRIQEMAAEEIHAGNADEKSIIWKIEADARAAIETK